MGVTAQRRGAESAGRQEGGVTAQSEKVNRKRSTLLSPNYSCRALIFALFFPGAKSILGLAIVVQLHACTMARRLGKLLAAIISLTAGRRSFLTLRPILFQRVLG